MKNQLITLKTAIAFFQLAVMQQPIPDLAGLLAGSALVVVGLTLFVPPSIIRIA